MIAKSFEQFILAQEETFLTPAKQLAVIIDTHHIDHAKLLLSHMTYTRVPVVQKDGTFVGTIGLTEINRYQMENDLKEADLEVEVITITKRDVSTLKANYTLTEVMHKLVDQAFLPVVDDDHKFTGIITRKSILKAVNHLLHNFESQYNIKEK